MAERYQKIPPDVLPFLRALNDTFGQSVYATTESVKWATYGNAISGITYGITKSLPQSRVMTHFLDHIVRGIPPQQYKDANLEIARKAQLAVARRYDQRRGRRRLPSYRVGSNRYSGGALRRAIMAPDFYEATATGIKFINRDRLSREAAQWKRLNYGAGGGAGTPPRQFSVMIGGQLAATLGIAADPQPGFRLPPGFFIGPGGERQPRRGPGPGSGMFFPTRSNPKDKTFGILASNFLDAGVRSIADNMPVAYMGIYGRWFDRFATLSGAASKGVTFKAPRIQVRGKYTRLPDIPYSTFLERGYIGRFEGPRT